MAEKDFSIKNGLNVGSGSWVVNATGLFYGESQIANTTHYFNSNVAITSNTANNAAFLGGTAAASYQLNSTLSSNVVKLTSNNSSFLGGVAAAAYVNTSGNYTLSGNLVFSANVNFDNIINVGGNKVPSPASQASGDILYRGDTDWLRLPKGGAAQILTMNPGATAPAWSTAASSSEYTNNTADKVIDTDGVWGAAAEFPLTDAAPIAVNMAEFLNASVTLGASRTLGDPTNTKVGQTGYIRIIQPGSGGPFTLSYDTNWKFGGGVTPVLTTTANAVDILFYQVISSTFILASLVRDVRR